MKFATAAYMQPSFSMLHQTMYGLAALIFTNAVWLRLYYATGRKDSIYTIICHL